jgi:Aldo/keto reductase family
VLNQIHSMSRHDYGQRNYVAAAQQLADMQAAGKLRRIGLTNFDVRRTAELLDAGVPLVSNQVDCCAETTWPIDVMSLRTSHCVVEACSCNTARTGMEGSTVWTSSTYFRAGVAAVFANLSTLSLDPI